MPTDQREDRRYYIDMSHCIHPECDGELYEVMYDESINWITVVYKCTGCGADFTVKVEV